MIYAVAEGANDVVRQAVQADRPGPELIAAAVVEVRRVCSTKRAQREAERLVDQAIERLEPFPDGPAKDALIDLAMMVVQRKM